MKPLEIHLIKIRDKGQHFIEYTLRLHTFSKFMIRYYLRP